MTANDGTTPLSPPAPPRDEAEYRARLKAAAERALAEAAQRRAQAGKGQAQAAVREIGGPAGPEPTRYGDWERKGLASDF